MKIMPISSTRIYARSNNQLNYTNMTQARDTVSFGSACTPHVMGSGRSNTIAKIQKDIGKAIKENNVKEILEYFGIKCKADKNNLLTISYYAPRVRYVVTEGTSYCKSIFFSELGINENNLFKKIIAIDYDADFGGSELTNLGRLEKIGGIVDFRHSKVTDLGELKTIGGGAVFRDSQVSDLGKLETIGEYADFENSKITNLGKLETIGHDACFDGSQVTYLGELKRIGGTANFENSKITNLGKLESIGWSAHFNDSQITDLGELKTIGGDAYFKGSKVSDLGKLKTIEGNAYFSGSQVTDLGKLETIELSLDISNTNIANLGKLKSVGSGRPSLYAERSYVIKLNEHINPKDAEHLVTGKVTENSIITVKANSTKQYKKPNDRIEQPKKEITEKPNSKIEQPKKEIIEKPINNHQKQKTNEKPSFVQRLKNAWKALTGN